MAGRGDGTDAWNNFLIAIQPVHAPRLQIGRQIQPGLRKRVGMLRVGCSVVGIEPEAGISLLHVDGGVRENGFAINR